MAKKTSSYLGVDLGGGGIKMVECAADAGRARLLTYAHTNQGPVDENWFADKKKTADLIQKMYTKAGVRTRRAVTGLPVYAVFSSVITVPKIEQKGLAEAIRAQVSKLVGQKAEDLAIDWKVLEEINQRERAGYIRVLATAAKKKLVADYTEVFTLAGLKLASLETETYAYARSLIGKDPATILLVDMGSERTNVVIVKEGAPILGRSIRGGGVILTEAIMKSANLSRSEAERLKSDASFSESGGFPKIFEEALQPLITEIKYFLQNYFVANEGVKQIDRMILTGGSARLSGLAEFFGRLFNLRVFLGDPWARVLYDEALRPVLDEIGPRFAVALGLALREIEE